ncbi:MAG: hypothetical protein ACTSWW_08965 [Promethearchaeota archaeon]
MRRKTYKAFWEATAYGSTVSVSRNYMILEFNRHNSVSETWSTSNIEIIENTGATL